MSFFIYYADVITGLMGKVIFLIVKSRVMKCKLGPPEYGKKRFHWPDGATD